MNEQSVLLSSFYKTQSFWNMPVPFTSLVGREQEIVALVHSLRRPDIRLLTLLGTAGIGKTRLSIQAAREARSYFSDGVCFVALASINHPERVLPAIAESLDIHQRVETPLFEQVAYFLSDRQMLLILDNFEQVMNAAPLLEELLSACPLLKLLVTSREVLHLQAEHEFPVSPLTLPSPVQVQEGVELSRHSAIALFVQRAQAALPGFQITQRNAQAKVYFIESIALAKPLGRKNYLSYCLSLLARVAAAQGQFQQAASLYGTAETGVAMEKILNESEYAEYQRDVAAVRTHLGDVAFATAWAEGQTLTVEQVLATLQDETRSKPVPALLHHPSVVLAPARSLYPDDLTPREVEVLRLLARGWTDVQIAEYLVISRRTVNNHITSIYSKIAVTSRSAAYALRD